MNYDYSGDFKASILFTYAPLHSFGSGVKTIRVYGKWLVRKDSTFDQGIPIPRHSFNYQLSPVDYENCYQE